MNISKCQIETMAAEIRDCLIENDMWLDVRIYYNGKAMEGNRIIEDIDPRDYFSYVGDILSMSFEGDLYECLNYYKPMQICNKIEDDLQEILSKCGVYYELGNAWNLSVFPLSN